MLVQKSRRPRRWAGVASFAVLLVALWWMEHRDAARVDVPPPEPVQVNPPEAPGGLTGLGPSFSNEPITATDAEPVASAPAPQPQ